MVVGESPELGLTADTEDVTQFANSTLATLAEGGVDFTVFFDRLTRVAVGETDELLLDLFGDPSEGGTWIAQWQALRLEGASAQSSMRRANPAVIARNHRVEQAIDAAMEDEDFQPFRRLCRALAKPLDLDPQDHELQIPPLPEERVTQTFCGT